MTSTKTTVQNKRLETGAISIIQQALADPYTHYDEMGTLKLTELDINRVINMYPTLKSGPFTYSILECFFLPKTKSPIYASIISSEYTKVKGLNISFNDISPIDFVPIISSKMSDNKLLLLRRSITIKYPKLYMPVKCKVLLHKIVNQKSEKDFIRIMAMTTPELL
jgi:hypothetical protein